MMNTGTSARKDRNIVRAVPFVALISAIAGLILVLTGPKDLGSILIRFCAPFMFGFAALGFYSLTARDKGLLDGRITVMIFILTPLLFSVSVTLVAENMMPEILNILNRVAGADVHETVMIFISVYAITLLMSLTSHGVISTVVAYFRSYTTRIYLSIEKIKNDDSDTTRNKISRWVYQIPEIIDIERIEFDPVPGDGKFPRKVFVSLTLSIFVLGLSISSYIFLNPIFAGTLSLDEAVIVTMILTFFVPVLVIPWSITRDTGAKIKSQAKDYYLWKGMKKRIYGGFFTFMVFLTMFAVCVYLGYDLERMFYTYLGYIIITAFTSLLYAFVYADYYYTGFKEGIIEDFNEAKK
jgi:hypothetical protein